jgi:predicted amidohydrolase YtcJ
VTGRPGLAAALVNAPTDADGWVRGVGYVETVAGDLDAATLDQLLADRPVRIQHRSGALWIVNGIGVERLGLDRADHPGVERSVDGSPTGRLWRADAWLRARLPPSDPPDLGAVGRRLAALGITSVCDASPDLDRHGLAALVEATASGALPTRLQVLGAALPVRELPAGVTVGPYKIVLADSALPGIDELAHRIQAAHSAGRAVAVHCVTREALVLLLATLELTGVRPGDRIEHAAIVPVELIPRVAVLGLRVVTQPGFLVDRGDDYVRDVASEDLPDLYRCRSLVDAGIPVSLSSDAPYGPLDPWLVMSAAASRTAASGAVVGAEERLPVERALLGYLSAPESPGGPPRRIRSGCPADLVLLDRPAADIVRAPDASAVRMTMSAGRVVAGP